jgi:DNA-binding helix-hairpin-helix protein with protein kinase domain
MAIQMTKAQLNKLAKLAEGGEATIYSYDKGTVLKIFKNPAVLSVKEQKVSAMLGKKSRGNLVILPTDIVTIGGKFVGYQMPVVTSGEPLHSFTKARFIRDHGFTNLDALQIVTQLSHAVDEVHNAGFVIGDVSDNNFMASIDSGHQIHLIDTDSWGINGLAPDSYTETFTPPEAYNGKKGMRLTEETDNFGYFSEYWLTDYQSEEIIKHFGKINTIYAIAYGADETIWYCKEKNKLFHTDYKRVYFEFSLNRYKEWPEEYMNNKGE